MRTLRTRRRPKAGAALAGLLLAFPLVARAGDYRPAVAATVDEHREPIDDARLGIAPHALRDRQVAAGRMHVPVETIEPAGIVRQRLV